MRMKPSPQGIFSSSFYKHLFLKWNDPIWIFKRMIWERVKKIFLCYNFRNLFGPIQKYSIKNHVTIQKKESFFSSVFLFHFRLIKYLLNAEIFSNCEEITQDICCTKEHICGGKDFLIECFIIFIRSCRN